MISGLVYFDEIVEAVKDATGIENMYPYYEKLKRFVMRSEYDIAPSGLIVRKKLTYTIGDGYYDGITLSLPYDFMGEYSYAKLNTVNFRGNHLEIIEQPGPESIDLSYMGMLLDPSGNPVSTRNHFEAVVMFCVWKLYAPKSFLGVGNRNVLNDYKRDYDNLVLASRGNDAFGTEEDWNKLGAILRANTENLIADELCGEIVIDAGSTGTNPPPSGDCSTDSLTVDMVQVYNTAKTT